ncbi:MAG TPA: NAD-dependent epimerase/dehydratase family protein [Solirubrobacteraceae bacterium]|nr:NAD-dependent epimerase/dehydratase family protein [Solirubrobacteraceae bacterium]
MRVVVVGASGNIGTSVLAALGGDAEVSSIIAIARRPAPATDARIEWRARDVTRHDLRGDLEGADAVICLHWLIQPSRDLETVRATNVDSNRRVFEAAAAAGVPALLYSSSVGAYSPGPKDRAVDESWPTQGIQTSFYSRHKAEVERILDEHELAHPEMRVVRMRPALVFKREAASEIRRLFAGPLLPSPLVRRTLIPVVPKTDRLRFQAVHSLDVGEAFRLALHAPVDGAFNLAADPVLDGDELGRLLDAKQLRLHPGLLRALADVTWRLRLQPSPAGWVDMALGVPIMSAQRARTELGWTPRHSATDALLELLAGLRDDAGAPTPRLDPEAGGRFRAREFLSGIGARES